MKASRIDDIGFICLWIEYINGSRQGEKVMSLLESTERLVTPATCLTEIKRKCIREKKPWKTDIQFIQAHSRVEPVTKEIALKAGEIKELRFADVRVYAAALKLDATVVTGNPHFKDLAGVEFLE